MAVRRSMNAEVRSLDAMVFLVLDLGRFREVVGGEEWKKRKESGFY